MADETYRVAEDFKATVKLVSGKEVVIDLMKTTTKAWKQITNTKTTDEEEYAILSKATGLKPEELEALPQPDYRSLVNAYLKLGTQPLINPT